MLLKRIAAISALTLVLTTGAANAKTSGISSTASKIDASLLSKIVPGDGANDVGDVGDVGDLNNKPNPSPQTTAFPVGGTRKNEVVRKGYMETSFNLDSNGNLNARTRTWTDVKLKGFTGGVLIAFTDASRTPIWSSEQQRYGVDGTYIGKSDRTENWQAKVPPEIVSRITGYVILQEYTPRSRVFDWIRSPEGQQIIKDIVSLFK